MLLVILASVFQAICLKKVLIGYWLAVIREVSSFSAVK
jgi:hypothetical protein